MNWFGRENFTTRRWEARIGGPASLTACYWDGGTSRPRKVRDISRTGAFIEAEAEWRAGTVIHVAFEYGDPNRSCDQTVFGLWAQIVKAEPEGIGIEFIMRNAAELRQFRKFLHRITEEARGVSGIERRPALSLRALRAAGSSAAGRIRSLL